MSSNTVYVITGANRGLGLGLVQALLARPRTTVVGTVRNGAAAAALRAATTTTTGKSSSSASASPWGEGSVLEIVELDLSVAPTPATVRAALLAATGGGDGGLARVDVLVNNAAAMTPLVRAASTAAADLRAAFETNAIAPLAVTQGAWPLLRRGRAPKVVMVSSTVGMLAEQEAPGGAYGASKAALNWLTRALHLENGPPAAGAAAAEEGQGEGADDETAPIPGLVAFALHPGWVQTQAGAHAAREWGVDMAPPETVEGSVRGMLEVIDGATRDTVSGRFVTYKGVELAW